MFQTDQFPSMSSIKYFGFHCEKQLLYQTYYDCSSIAGDQTDAQCYIQGFSTIKT